VAARTAARAGRNHEDLVAIVGSLADGTVTSHLVNWLSPVKERRITVNGSAGSFVADTLTADLAFYANGQVRSVWDDISRFRGVTEGDMVRYALEKPEPLLVELTQFLAAARGEPASVVSLAEGLATLEVAEAVLASAAVDQTVTLPR
jgi:predicted dehydrogenase